MIFAVILAFSTGLLSLSEEILWVRLFSYANHSLPQAFSFVLAFYLMGIALGAWVGKLFCRDKVDLWKVSGLVLLVSGCCDVWSPGVYALFSHSEAQLVIGAALIMLTATLKAILFPIAHHLGASSFGNHIGRSISRVYVANILGATLGPIIMGLFLLDFLTTQECFFDMCDSHHERWNSVPEESIVF